MKNVGLEQGRASNRLSSGFRINSAADDAAGLAISENMRAQIRGLDQASRNAQDGQAMLLTTEGGLEEIGNMLVRVRELMVQASNDTNTQDQRGLIEQEIGQLGREILSMQNRIEFNTNRVLAMGPAMTATVVTASGEMAISAQNQAVVGAALQHQANITTAAIDMLSELNPGDTALSGAAQAAFDRAVAAIVLANFGQVRDGGLAGAVAVAADAITIVTNAMANAATAGATVAETITNLQTQLADINSEIDDLAANNGGAMRMSFTNQSNAVRAFVGANTSGNNVAFFQVGANASQGINFDFETVSRAVAGAGWTVSLLASAMSAPAAGSGIGNGVTISPFINAVDASIDDISRTRANLGSLQNRMDFTMRSLDISSENLQDSESRVRNADIAREMMRFTMTNVLQQAAVSMLSQANQLPNNLLQLLR